MSSSSDVCGQRKGRAWLCGRRQSLSSLCTVTYLAVWPVPSISTLQKHLSLLCCWLRHVESRAVTVVSAVPSTPMAAWCRRALRLSLESGACGRLALISRSGGVCFKENDPRQRCSGLCADRCHVALGCAAELWAVCTAHLSDPGHSVCREPPPVNLSRAPPGLAGCRGSTDRFPAALQCLAC